MNYEEMSDFEINKAVAEHFYDTDWLDRHATHAGMIPDYCNNPSDAWPIIDSIFWQLTSADELGVTEWARLIRKEDCSDKLRAAMIVFLMIKDAECQKS